MTREQELYAKAGELARIAMGREKWGRGRGTHRYWVADEDPLAWWELTECIASIAMWFRDPKRKPHNGN